MAGINSFGNNHSWNNYNNNINKKFKLNQNVKSSGTYNINSNLNANKVDSFVINRDNQTAQSKMQVRDCSGSFGERFNYYANYIAKENGYDNLGQMAASNMQHCQTTGAGAGPALAALILTVGSYFRDWFGGGR